MPEDTQTHKDIHEGFSLKVPDRKISSEEPWADDALDRTRVATALTNLVRNQSEPLTISLHGNWGTGKTFLLQRWQKDLENNGFKSIYFNAWEDDFCDDPFVAIIGQLSEFLKNEKYNSINNKLKTTVKPIIKKIGLNILSKAISVDLNEILEQFADKTLSEYSLQNANKDKLKKSLQEISDKVHKETKQPLIFIIDELDRCRPTFAIELLERVKHIFDIPGIVFVFGINHDELCSAIESIYGEIDADTYLRRFFDMGFLLPEADLEKFSNHLIERYKLRDSFSNLRIGAGHHIHWEDFDVFSRFLPAFYSRLDLSLRDVDHCIRSLAFVGKTIGKAKQMFPHLVGALIFLRLKKQTLYKEFIRGECFGADVMNYINEVIFDENMDDDLKHTLHIIEIHLYLVDARRGRNSFEQLKNLLQGSQPTHPEYLSKKVMALDNSQETDIETIKDLNYLASSNWPRPGLKYISSLIELTEISAQREPLWR